MTSSAEIIVELQALGGIIARAQAELAADSLLDLSSLEGDIEDNINDLATGLPIRRLAEPKEVAYAALFLASDRARSISPSGPRNRSCFRSATPPVTGVMSWPMKVSRMPKPRR